MIEGIDVSQFSWLIGEPEALLPRAAFAIVRGTSGLDHVDTLAEKHIAIFSAAGIPTLSLYGYFKSYLDGAQQAEHAHRVARDFGLPLFANFEPVGKGTRPSDAPHLARGPILAFLRRWAELRGTPCPVYGPAFYLRDLRLDPSVCGPLWVAHVGANGAPKMTPPMVPTPFQAFAVHQFQHNADAGPRADAPNLRAVVDWNRSPHTLLELRAMLGAPLPYDELGPVVSAVRQAEGRGERAEDFDDTDPGVR